MRWIGRRGRGSVIEGPEVGGLAGRSGPVESHDVAGAARADDGVRRSGGRFRSRFRSRLGRRGFGVGTGVGTGVGADRAGARVGLGVGLGVGTGVGVGLGVGSAVRAGVGAGVATARAVGVGEGEGEGVLSVGEAVGVGEMSARTMANSEAVGVPDGLDGQMKKAPTPTTASTTSAIAPFRTSRPRGLAAGALETVAAAAPVLVTTPLGTTDGPGSIPPPLECTCPEAAARAAAAIAAAPAGATSAPSRPRAGPARPPRRCDRRSRPHSRQSSLVRLAWWAGSWACRGCAERDTSRSSR